MSRNNFKQKPYLRCCGSLTPFVSHDRHDILKLFLKELVACVCQMDFVDPDNPIGFYRTFLSEMKSFFVSVRQDQHGNVLFKGKYFAFWRIERRNNNT